MIKLIKHFLYSIVLIGLFATVVVHASGPSDCRNPQDWLSFGGFTHDQQTGCPDGLGYPAMNAYRDEPIFPGSNLPAYNFAFVRNNVTNNNSQPNFGFSNSTTLRNNSESAQFFIYTHNAGNAMCNTNNQSTLNANNCSQNTIARNVRVRIVSGLTRQANGTYQSQPGSRHRITFEISADNTTPRTLRSNITVNTPPNKVLVLSTNPSHNTLNTRNNSNSYTSSSLMGNGVLLASSFAGSGNTQDYYASQDYRVQLYGVLNMTDPETPACRSLNLQRTTGDIQYPLPIGYRVQLSPDSPQFRQNLNYRVLRGPGSNQPNVFINRRVGTTASPAVILSNWKDGTRVEIFVDGEPDCKQIIEFPGAFCRSLDLTPRNINYENGTANFEVRINSSLNAREVARRLNMSNLTGRVAFTAQPNRRSLSFGEVIQSSGRFLPRVNNYRFTVSDVAPGKSFTMQLPGFEEVCNAEFSFEGEDCRSFDIQRTISGQESIFSITNLQPPSFRGDVIWSITRPGGGGAFADQRTITQTFVVNNSELPPGTVIRARLVDPATGTADCSGELTIPTDDQVCENITINPRNIRAGERPTFTLTDIRPDELGGQVLWEVVDVRNNANRVETRTLGVNQPFRPARELGEDFQVYVEHESIKSCQDLIRVETDITPGRCESLTLTSNKPFRDNETDILFTAETEPGDNYGLIWTLRYQDGTEEDVQTGGNTYLLRDPRNVTAIGVGERFDTHQSPCTDFMLKDDDDDDDDDEDSDRVCRQLVLTDVSTGTQVTNLPSQNRILNVNLRTIDSGFEDQVRITSATNTSVFRQNDQLWILTTSPTASLTLGVPGEDCSWTATRTADTVGNEVKLRKEIQNLPSSAFGPNPYTFANVSQNIRYRLRPEFGSLNFPAGTTFTLTDTIQGEITGLRRGANRQAERVPGATLSLNNDSFQFPANFNLGQLSSLTRDGFIYTGSVNWSTRVNDCEGFTGDCSAQFPNFARLTINFPNNLRMQNSTGISNITVRSNTAHAIVVCPFVVSRGFGEVFLEQAIPGADLASCGLRHTQSPVFTRAPAQAEVIVQVGAGESQKITRPTHGICRALAEDEITNEKIQEILQDTNIQNFSSATCQTALISAERWQKEQINQSLINTFSRLTRNAQDITNQPINSIPANLGSRNRISLSNGNLTVGSNNEVKIEGNSARTIVVYGDLNIKSNIRYSEDARGVVAFVVIGGNIVIEPGVTEINGIFVTIPGEGGNGGSFRWEGHDEGNWPPAELEQIIIRGSAYGNINPLIQASAPGDLARDRGGVSVLFDGRITRRIPPGLQDVIKFNQFQVATQSLFFSGTE